MTTASQATTRWKTPAAGWVLTIAALLALMPPFLSALKDMVGMWSTNEEFNYAYVIPFVTLFQIWQRKEKLARIPFKGSWAGVILAVLGFCLMVLGNLSTIQVIVQYAFLVVVAGVVLSFTGREAFRLLLVPLSLLVFTVPLPQFFLQEISTHLQLLSSALGVAVIRLFGISVFLEGNVIDLGNYQLQVAEACSGLRYLFPLMALGFIAACFFNGPFWKRVLIFLSAIPITVLMNSFRIGMIGVLVEYWGRSMADGFLHDFEGWAVFMACMALLVAEMSILGRVGSNGLPLRHVFRIEWPEPAATAAKENRYRSVPKPFWAALVVVVLFAVLATALPQRDEPQLARSDFSAFPMQLGEWKGKPDRLEPIYLEALKLDDYLLADYRDPSQHVVNLYAAYYASQRSGQSAHSPRTCIPGGGWTIETFTQTALDGVTSGGVPLTVNRALIQLGGRKQLVYYWFQQRGRTITNEYAVKWFILWDSLIRNRSDGALVRLATPVDSHDTEATADQRLASFAKLVTTRIETYVPGRLKSESARTFAWR